MRMVKKENTKSFPKVKIVTVCLKDLLYHTIFPRMTNTFLGALSKIQELPRKFTQKLCYNHT